MQMLIMLITLSFFFRLEESEQARAAMANEFAKLEVKKRFLMSMLLLAALHTLYHLHTVNDA